MYASTQEILDGGQQTRYRLSQHDTPLTFAQVLALWGDNPAFRSYFNQLLASSEYKAFRWETPALTDATQHLPFEFVLLNTPQFQSRRTDSHTFATHFTVDGAGVKTFCNLGGDAKLIVPSPRCSHDAYGHLAAFVRHAPAAQASALWATVADEVSSRVTSTPLWLSTAGGGVAWLHVRIDSSPKYYGHLPYKSVADSMPRRSEQQ
jgi:hypothetical protein